LADDQCTTNATRISNFPLYLAAHDFIFLQKKNFASAGIGLGVAELSNYAMHLSTQCTSVSGAEKKRN